MRPLSAAVALRLRSLSGLEPWNIKIYESVYLMEGLRGFIQWDMFTNQMACTFKNPCV